MEGISDPNLRAYIVWLPVLPSGAHEPAARRETKRIRDNRAVQFFDAEARAGKAYSSILHLPSGLPAWDVYLVFGPKCTGREARLRQPIGCINWVGPARRNFAWTVSDWSE